MSRLLRMLGPAAALVLSLALTACATNRMDYWQSPNLSSAPIPTREQVVVVLPVHARVAGDSDALEGLAESGFMSQLEHATVAVGGQELAADLAAVEVKDPADDLGQAMAHAAFVENSEILSAEHSHALGLLMPINRVIEDKYAGQPLRWLAVLRIEELPSAKDMQARLQITTGLWDLKRNALASVVQFERYAEEGKLGGTVRRASIDAASRLTLDTSTPVAEPVEVGP